MAVLTLSLAASGLAAATILVVGSSTADEPPPQDQSVPYCQTLASGYQRAAPDGRCAPRSEVISAS